MKIRQLDIATAYLTGDLEEQVLMRPLKDFERILQDIEELENGKKPKNILKLLERMQRICWRSFVRVLKCVYCKSHYMAYSMQKEAGTIKLIKL